MAGLLASYHGPLICGEAVRGPVSTPKIGALTMAVTGPTTLAGVIGAGN